MKETQRVLNVAEKMRNAGKNNSGSLTMENSFPFALQIAKNSSVFGVTHNLPQ